MSWGVFNLDTSKVKQRIAEVEKAMARVEEEHQKAWNRVLDMRLLYVKYMGELEALKSLLEQDDADENVQPAQGTEPGKPGVEA